MGEKNHDTYKYLLTEPLNRLCINKTNRKVLTYVKILILLMIDINTQINLLKKQ